MIYVMLGGAIGAVTRWLLTKWLPSFWGTAFVNIVGSLIGGFLIRLSLHEQVQLLLLTGFLGAFTTFSSLQIEGFKLIEDGNFAKGIAYTFLTLITSIGMAGIGVGVAGFFAV